MIKQGLTTLAVLGALTAAGCGGGDDNKTLSYSDFGKEADKICTDVNQKTSTLGSLTGKAQADADVLPKVVDAVEQGRKDFAELKPPDELKADYDKFLAITDQQIANTKKAAEAAKAGDQQGYEQALQDTRPLQAQSNAAASKLGAPVCAK